MHRNDNKTNQGGQDLPNLSWLEDTKLREQIEETLRRKDDEAKSDQEKERNQLNFFFADTLDPALRDQRDMMMLPFFSLQKRKRTRPLIYERNGIRVVVAGLTTTGIATIWDADFLIWAASQLNEAVRRGDTPTRRLWVVPYHFLVQTKRMNPSTISGGNKAYREFEQCLRRLQGTTIETNIKADREHITKAWSWIDSWEAHKDEKGRVKGIEIWLSQWLFIRVVKDKAILSISSDYFLMTGGIERWLYRIARKHCGNNDVWRFSIKALYEKYPPGREFRFFKRDLKKVVGADCLPEYHTFWEEEAKGRKTEAYVIFIPREGSREARSLPRSARNIISQ